MGLQGSSSLMSLVGQSSRPCEGILKNTLEMKCFPFCCAIDVKRIKTSQVTPGQIEDSLQGETAPPRSQGMSVSHRKDRDVELVVRNSDAMVTERESTSCKHDILESSRASGRLQIDFVEARDCQSESNLIVPIENDGCRLDDKNKLSCQNFAAYPRCPTLLGPNIQVFRSLPEIFQEAKRKHLPPLKSLRKDRNKYRRENARPRLLFIKNKNRLEDHFAIDNDTLKRDTRNWDEFYPRMHYPEMNSYKSRSVDQDDWKSIEDILSMDLSSDSSKVPKWRETGSDSTTKKIEDKRSKVGSSLDVTEKERNSSVYFRNKNEMEETKYNISDVIYDDSELELMKDIEREFLKN